MKAQEKVKVKEIENADLTHQKAMVARKALRFENLKFLSYIRGGGFNRLFFLHFVNSHFVFGVPGMINRGGC